MKRIIHNGSGEIIEKKSRFIANIINIANEEEAERYIESVRKKYWDARHCCFAYVCGKNNEIQKSSDDGEPSGTAGKPILEVIKGKEIGNVLITVTRYFGGTLLGTGGLIRAYQAAALEGIKNSEITEVCEGIMASVITEYSNVGKLQYICSENDIIIEDSVYGEKVEIKIIIPLDKEKIFNSRIQDAFSGNMKVEIGTDVLYAISNGKSLILEEN